MHDFEERIISKEGILLYLTEGTTRYLGNNKSRKIGFYKGKPEANDINLSICITDSMIKVNASVQDNDDISGIVIEDDIHSRKIDFVYNGISVEFEFINTSKSRYRLKINNQWIDFSDDRLAVLADEKSIKYFGERKVDSGERFDSYVIPHLNEEDIALADVFIQDLTEGMRTSKENGYSDFIYLRKTEEYVKVFHEYMELEEKSYDEYRIISRNTASKKMKFLIENLNDINKIMEAKQVERMIASPYRLLGMNETADRLKFMLQKAAKTNTTIMITGESGTGKTFLAKEIHNSSRRSSGDFVHVNCAAIPYNLVESELFGHEDGAFTGAKKGGKKGYFDMAEGGTLFLDEISEIPLELQGRLLEVIQSNTFYRVGGTQKMKSDIRLIVATNRDLAGMVDLKLFREDLYYRINVFPVELPPLRERYMDFKFIINTLLSGICIRLEMEPVIITDEAIEYSKLFPWKGNLRELENILERAVILSESEVITKGVLDYSINAFNAQARNSENMLEKVREDAEAKLIRDTLQKTGGNKKLASQILGIGRTSLFEKIKKYDI